MKNSKIGNRVVGSLSKVSPETFTVSMGKSSPVTRQGSQKTSQRTVLWCIPAVPQTKRPLCVTR